MADRAADDMGGLMHIISKYWTTLPEEKKAAYQIHLREQHHLLITDQPVPLQTIKGHYPFIPRLEKSLQHHFHQALNIKQSIADGEPCFWAVLPLADSVVYIGFLHERFGPHPSKAILGILAGGLLLISITTLFLARRITRPIKTLSNAVNLIGSGKLSTRIPENGPQELAMLAHSFNCMAQEISQLMSNRSILFGGISHDLRTPITRMQIAIELLENESNTDLITGMRNDLNEMEKLIQNALEFVKGMDKHHAFNIKINKVLNELAENYARQNQIIHWQSNCGQCQLLVLYACY
jgi:two-component system osmolarity sensor histidine kinase EnvZ